MTLPWDVCCDKTESVTVWGILGAAMLVWAVGVRADAPESSGGEIRRWGRQTGKHAIEAALVEIRKDQIVLQRPDGKRIEVDPAASARPAIHRPMENSTGRIGPSEAGADI